jgi:uncharacterized protein (TIGR02145 family)
MLDFIKRCILVVFLLQLHQPLTQAQNVLISETQGSPHASSILELFSTDKGFLLPRLSVEQRDSIINPAQALIIFNTTSKCLEIFVQQWFSLWCPDSLCGLPIQDIQGNTYQTVQIGNQCWMSENLKATVFNDGTHISHITDNTQWVNLSTPAYCWFSNDSVANSGTGALYNWYVTDSASNGGKNICPAGWRVPNDNDWYILENYIDSSINDPNSTGWRGTDGGTKLRATYSWAGTPGNGSDDYNFTAIATGFRFVGTGHFQSQTSSTRFWTTTPVSASNAYMRGLTSASSLNGPKIFRSTTHSKKDGNSIRCIRD